MSPSTNDVTEQAAPTRDRRYRSKSELVTAYLPQVKYEEMPKLATMLLELCPTAAMHLAGELQTQSGAILLPRLPKGYKYRVLSPDGDLQPVRKFK